jgi:hypothetical protein
MKKIFTGLILVPLLLGSSVYAQQSTLFEYESIQSFDPAFAPDDNSKELQSLKKDASLYRFQLADPKGPIIPAPVSVQAMPETSIVIEDNKKKTPEKLKKVAEVKPNLEIIDNDNNEGNLPEMPSANPLPTLKPVKIIPDDNLAPEIKESIPVQDNTKLSLTGHSDTTKPELKDTNTEISKNEVVQEANTEQVEVIKAPETSSVKGANPEEIDYYLKKYTATLEGEANITDYKYSLIEPFKQSLFFELLNENKAKDVELQTHDVTADFKPEAIVSYNVPLGADGDLACQIMVLTPSETGLDKVWVSELIPGEIDSVMVQDVNNDAQNDIITVSTAGGVSLLKSIRVYSYNKSDNTFITIFAMNGIMEGIVNVRPGKILVSETFPGGINRAALYVWNGKRFERVEL